MPLRINSFPDRDNPRAGTLATTTVEPSALTWVLKNIGRELELVSAGFEDFTFDIHAARLPVSWVQSINGSATTSNGASTIDTVCSASSSLLQSTFRGPLSTYWAAEVNVAAVPATSGLVEVGIALDANNLASVLYTAGDIKIHTTIAAVDTVSTVATVTLTAPYRLAAVQTGRFLSAFYDTGGGWIFAGAIDLSARADLTLDSGRAGWRYFYRFSGTGTGQLTWLKAGIFGTAGISSQYVVTYEDGTPIMDGRDIFIVAASAGVFVPSANDLTPAHTAVWRWNLDTDVHTIVSHLFTRRSGHTLGDAFGPLIFDRNEKTWRFFPQNTGDSVFGSGARVLMASSKVSLLSGVHVLAAAVLPLPLPNAGYQTHDADVRRIDGLWYCAYTERSSVDPGLNWYPALCTASDLDGTWTQLATDPTLAGAEGARLVKMGADWRAIWCHALPSTLHNYDLTLTQIGTGFTPASWPNQALASHPMIFAAPTPSGNSKWKIFTFDAVATWSGQPWAYGNWETFEATVELPGVTHLPHTAL